MSQDTQPTGAGGVDQAGRTHKSRIHAPKHGWFHEVEKRVMGQTPKGISRASRPSKIESHRSRSTSGELDLEAETIFRRTARYGGDDPRDPQDRAYEPVGPSEGSHSDNSTHVYRPLQRIQTRPSQSRALTVSRTMTTATISPSKAVRAAIQMRPMIPIRSTGTVRTTLKPHKTGRRQRSGDLPFLPLSSRSTSHLHLRLPRRPRSNWLSSSESAL